MTPSQSLCEVKLGHTGSIAGLWPPTSLVWQRCSPSVRTADLPAKAHEAWYTFRSPASTPRLLATGLCALANSPGRLAASSVSLQPHHSACSLINNPAALSAGLQPFHLVCSLFSRSAACQPVCKLVWPSCGFTSSFSAVSVPAPLLGPPWLSLEWPL